MFLFATRLLLFLADIAPRLRGEGEGVCVITVWWNFAGLEPVFTMKHLGFNIVFVYKVMHRL